MKPLYDNQNEDTILKQKKATILGYLFLFFQKKCQVWFEASNATEELGDRF